MKGALFERASSSLLEKLLKKHIVSNASLNLLFTLNPAALFTVSTHKALLMSEKWRMFQNQIISK